MKLLLQYLFPSLSKRGKVGRKQCFSRTAPPRKSRFVLVSSPSPLTLTSNMTSRSTTMWTAAIALPVVAYALTPGTSSLATLALVSVASLNLQLILVRSLSQHFRNRTDNSYCSTTPPAAHSRKPRLNSSSSSSPFPSAPSSPSPSRTRVPTPSSPPSSTPSSPLSSTP